MHEIFNNPGVSQTDTINFVPVQYDTSSGNLVIQGQEIALGGSGSGIGASLAYSPASGSVDPGIGITGFGGSTGRLKVTLSGNTTFAGLPAGADAQQLLIIVVSGAFTLTLTALGTTSGKQILASSSVVLSLHDALQLVYDAGLAQWVVLL